MDECIVCKELLGYKWLFLATKPWIAWSRGDRPGRICDEHYDRLLFNGTAYAEVSV